MASKEQGEASSPPDITVVLIGTLGSGKSCTGNTIIGSNQFPHGCGTLPITKTINTYNFNIPDLPLNLTVIDTPGFLKHNDLKIKNGIQPYERGKCVYLFVIRVGRYQLSDKNLLEGYLKHRKDNNFKTGIVLTSSAEILLTNQTIKQWLKTTPSLQRLIKDNELAYIAIENVNVDEKSKEYNRQELINLVMDLALKERSNSTMFDTNKSIEVTHEQLHTHFGSYGDEFYYKIKKQKSSNKLFGRSFGSFKTDPNDQ